MKQRRKAKFLSFEGGEGVGKTTQIARLALRFEKLGKEVVVTREPGGSTIANKIRSLLIDPKLKGLNSLAELFLYEASRVQHLQDTILPALKRGAIVLCDRFADSSLVYQGVARKISPRTVQQLNLLATKGLKPSHTFILNLDPRIGLARAGSRGVLDRIEQEQLAFHQAVRRGYIALAKREPKRCFLIDASQSRDKIHEDICEYLF